MIEAAKAKASHMKRVAIIGCAVGIVLIPSFVADAAMAIIIATLAAVSFDKIED